MVITVFQHVTNVAVADFTANQAAFTAALSMAIGNIIGASASDIHSVSIADVKVRDDSRRLTSMSEIHLGYDVRLWSATHDADYYTDLLRTATTGGTLQTAIRNAAFATPHASGLEDIVVDPSTSHFTANDRLHERGSSVLLTGTQIAGLVIGIVLFCVLLGLLIAFAMQNKIALPTPSASAATPGSPKAAGAVEMNKYREP